MESGCLDWFLCVSVHLQLRPQWFDDGFQGCCLRLASASSNIGQLAPPTPLLKRPYLGNRTNK
eukprot:6468984-Amphidinium_carterae.1